MNASGAILRLTRMHHIPGTNTNKAVINDLGIVGQGGEDVFWFDIQMQKAPIMDVSEPGGHAREELEPVGAELGVGAQDALFEIRARDIFKDAIAQAAKLSILVEVDNVGVIKVSVNSAAPAEAAALLPMEAKLG